MIELKRITAYTVKEAAEILGVVPTTVYRLIKRGDLRAQEIASKYYVTDKTLEEYVAGEKTRVPVVSSEEVKDDE